MSHRTTGEHFYPEYTHLSTYTDGTRKVVGVFLGNYHGRDMRAEIPMQGCELLPEQLLELVDQAIREWTDNQ